MDKIAKELAEMGYITCFPIDCGQKKGKNTDKMPDLVSLELRPAGQHFFEDRQDASPSDKLDRKSSNLPEGSGLSLVHKADKLTQSGTSQKKLYFKLRQHILGEKTKNSSPCQLAYDGESDAVAAYIAIRQYEAAIHPKEQDPLLAFSMTFRSYTVTNWLEGLVLEKVTWENDLERSRESLESKYEACRRHKVLALVLTKDDAELLTNGTQIPKYALSKNVFTKLVEKNHAEVPIVSCENNQLPLLLRALSLDRKKIRKDIASILLLILLLFLAGGCLKLYSDVRGLLESQDKFAVVVKRIFVGEDAFWMDKRYKESVTTYKEAGGLATPLVYEIIKERIAKIEDHVSKQVQKRVEDGDNSMKLQRYQEALLYYENAKIISLNEENTEIDKRISAAEQAVRIVEKIKQADNLREQAKEIRKKVRQANSLQEQRQIEILANKKFDDSDKVYMEVIVECKDDGHSNLRREAWSSLADLQSHFEKYEEAKQSQKNAKK